MLSVLANRTYRHLFFAQVIALIGTGMMTVALGLLAFNIAGDKAGAVLGTALAIKMVAYVGVAPVVGGFANYLPRRVFLVSMDLTRAASRCRSSIASGRSTSLSSSFRPRPPLSPRRSRRPFRTCCPTRTTIRGRCPFRDWPTIWKACSVRRWRPPC
jgi:hypothetical protein